MGLMEDMGLDVPLPESWAQASVRRKLGLAHGPTKLISSLVSRSSRMTTPWRSAFILDERGFRNTTRCGPPYSFDGEGLVVGAVNDQGRHVECRQIGAEVGGRERFRAFQHGFQAGLHSGVSCPVQLRFVDRMRDQVHAEEILEEARELVRCSFIAWTILSNYFGSVP